MHRTLIFTFPSRLRPLTSSLFASHHMLHPSIYAKRFPHLHSRPSLATLLVRTLFPSIDIGRSWPPSPAIRMREYLAIIAIIAVPAWPSSRDMQEDSHQIQCMPCLWTLGKNTTTQQQQQMIVTNTSPSHALEPSSSSPPHRVSSRPRSLLMAAAMSTSTVSSCNPPFLRRL
jgi:hypothetical protein